jgi:hypothetical protein
MSDPLSDRIKTTAKGPPNDPDKTIYLLDRVVVKDLAFAINVKPFKVVADLLVLGQFKNADEEVDFETASMIARKWGYRAQRPPPGVLVL